MFQIDSENRLQWYHDENGDSDFEEIYCYELIGKTKKCENCPITNPKVESHCEIIFMNKNSYEGTVCKMAITRESEEAFMEKLRNTEMLFGSAGVFDELTKENFGFSKTRRLLDSLSEMVVIFDLITKRVIEVNQEVINVLGYEREGIFKMKPDEVLGEDFLISIRRKEVKSAESRMIYETTLKSKWGDLIPVEVCISIIRGSQHRFILGSARNIAYRKNREEKINYLTFHDSMTGLYNRNYFAHSEKEINCEKNLPMGIIFCDVNGLKKINDIFGHKHGDKLIAGFAEILKKTCRKDDLIIRWGGDEFLVILPKTNKKEIKDIVKRINDNLEKSSNESMQLSAALGYAEINEYTASLDYFIELAEKYMYMNKSDSRS